MTPAIAAMPQPMVTAISDNDIQGGMRWMSFSAARAAWLYNVANAMLIVSLVGGLVATFLIVWMGNLKERNASAEASHLKERIAGADARAAEANRMAEQERLARVRIEAGLASRRLSSDQTSRFVSALIAAKGTIQGVDITLLGDEEAHAFGLELARAIQSAGVPVDITQVGVMAPPRYGLLVMDTPAGALKAVLDAADVPAQYTSATRAVPSILVGLKPPPF